MAEKTFGQIFDELRNKGYSDDDIVKALKSQGYSSTEYDLPISEASKKARQRRSGPTLQEVYDNRVMEALFNDPDPLSEQRTREEVERKMLREEGFAREDFYLPFSEASINARKKLSKATGIPTPDSLFRSPAKFIVAKNKLENMLEVDQRYEEKMGDRVSSFLKRGGDEKELIDRIVERKYDLSDVKKPMTVAAINAENRREKNKTLGERYQELIDEGYSDRELVEVMVDQGLTSRDWDKPLKKFGPTKKFIPTKKGKKTGTRPVDSEDENADRILEKYMNRDKSKDK